MWEAGKQNVNVLITDIMGCSICHYLYFLYITILVRIPPEQNKSNMEDHYSLLLSCILKIVYDITIYDMSKCVVSQIETGTVKSVLTKNGHPTYHPSCLNDYFLHSVYITFNRFK